MSLLLFNVEQRMILKCHRRRVRLLISIELPADCMDYWETRAANAVRWSHLLYVYFHPLLMSFCDKCQDIDEFTDDFCALSVLYHSKNWFMSGYTGVQQMKYDMNVYSESCLLDLAWCLECIFFIDVDIYRTSGLIWWPRKPEFAFAAIESWLKSKWNLVEHWNNFVIHKCIAWSKMNEFENDLKLSKTSNRTRLSVNHSAGDDLKAKHGPNNASAWVLCHHICDLRIEMTNCWNRYSNSQPIANWLWIPEGKSEGKSYLVNFFFSVDFRYEGRFLIGFQGVS